MNTLCRIAALSTVLVACTFARANEPISIASGSPLAAVQQAIDEAHAQGGGVVVLKPGEYTLDRAHGKSVRSQTLHSDAGLPFGASARGIGADIDHLMHAS